MILVIDHSYLPFDIQKQIKYLDKHINNQYHNFGLWHEVQSNEEDT